MGNAEDLERNKKAIAEYDKKFKEAIEERKKILRRQETYFNGLCNQKTLQLQKIRGNMPRQKPYEILVASHERCIDGIFEIATHGFEDYVTYDVVKSAESLERQASEKPYNLMFIKTNIPSKENSDYHSYDGVFNAIKNIREGKINSNTKMILMSGSDRHSSRARKLGIEDTLVGPIDFAELKVIISESLADNS